MLSFFKHQVSNFFANMGQIRIYNYLTNQLINQLTISEVGKKICNFSNSQQKYLMQQICKYLVDDQHLEHSRIFSK